MGLLSGLLGPAINVATNAMATHEGAEANAAATKIAFARQQQQDEIQRVLRERQEQSAGLRDQLVQAQIGDTQEQALDRQYTREHPKPVPIDPYSPEGLAARQQLEHDKIDYDRTHGYHAPIQGSYDPVQMTQDGQPITGVIDHHTGKVVPSGFGGKPTATGRNAGGTSKQKQDIAANDAYIKSIEDAEQELAAHGGAVGLGRGIWDKADQFIDPEGVKARADIANVGSLKIHERSGANVTAKEFPRLAPFVPGISDDSAAVATKLGKLKQHAKEERDAIVAQLGGAGGNAGGGAPGGDVAPGAGGGARSDWRTRARELKAQGLDKEAVRTRLQAEGYQIK